MAEVVFDNAPEEVLHAIIEFWHFKEGDHVDEGEDLVDLKADNDTSFTITAPVTGVLTNRLYNEDDEVEIGEVLAEIEEDTEVLNEDLDLEDLSSDENDNDDEIVAQEEVEEEKEEEETLDIEEEDEY